MRTNRRPGDSQNAILRYLLKCDVGGELYDPKNRWEYPESHIPWSTAAFLERKPTSSERATLAGSLEALEERGLVIRRRAGGKGVRTTHVILTALGQRAAEKLAGKHEPLDFKQLRADADRHQLEKDQAGLEAALEVLHEVFKTGSSAQQAKAATGAITNQELLWVIKKQLKDSGG